MEYKKDGKKEEGKGQKEEGMKTVWEKNMED